MSDHRATLVGLSMDDPTASVRDPAFQSLIRDGWSVAAHLPAERGGRQEWVMLMVPPQGPDTSNPIPWWRSQVTPLWLLVALHLLTLSYLLGVSP